MNELTPKLPQELQKTLEQYYSAPAPRPEFASRLAVQLRQRMERTRIRQDIPERMSFMKLLQTRPLVAMLIALLILLALSGVAYAIGKVTGYIPGVGIVDQSVSLRVLAEPVVVERDGLTVKIFQVVADSYHTFVAYGVNGIPQPANGFPVCGAMPSFQLPDGAKLDMLSGGGAQFGGKMGEPLSFETTVSYPPIPADVNHLTFVLPCILPEGTGPQNWQIPLELVPAPEGFATPGVEIGATFVASGPKFATTPTPTLDPASTPVQYDPSFPDTPTPVPNGSGLYLEQVIELSDSYILAGNFTDVGNLPGYVQPPDHAYSYLPKIEDAFGNEVAFKVRNDIQPLVNWGNAFYWTYEIAKPVHGALTITLDQVNITKVSTARFNFDTGPHPHMGQKWQINFPVPLGGYDYFIDSVEMIEKGYLFKYHSSIDIPTGTSLNLDIVATPQERGPSSEVGRGSGTVMEYSTNVIFLDSPPTGQITVELTLFETVPLQGPWTLTWAPPSK